jgi:MFS transporter, FSR family, fosmidomycin resistance protein
LKKQFQSGKVLAVSFAHMCHDIYGAFLSPIIPLLVNKLGISLSMAGMLDVIRSLPSLFNPLLGLLAERIRVKYFVIFTPILTAVIMSLIGIAPTYGVAAIMLFVMGISSTMFHIPSPVLIKDFSADKTGRGMSYYMLGGELSRSLGPLIITAAITLWGFEGTWRLIPYGVGASFLVYFMLRDYQRDEEIAKNRNGFGAGAAAKKFMPFLIPISGYMLFMLAIKVAVTLYLPAYLVNQGKTLMSSSFLLSVLQFSGAAGTLCAGSISDRIGRKATLYISGLACPILMWLFMVSGDAFMLPLLAALGFFLFASGPVILALVQENNPDSPAFANSMYMTITFIIRSLIVFLVGHYIEAIGFEMTYKIAAVASVGVLPFIFFFPKNIFRS